ncbi:MAG: B12-binding domain-containing radical SAM protein [Halochromatium sp.]
MSTLKSQRQLRALCPFRLLLIKPSHYDDEGYVIQWWRSSIPSNSLAAVYGNAMEAAEVLGAEVEIEVTALDESNTRIDTPRLIRRLRRGIDRDGGGALVGLVGVQSNQYPRALDLARRFKAADLPVVIGGFHVSGCLAMLAQWPPELQAALDAGISLFAGELEGRLDRLLVDAAGGRLAPIYNHLGELPELTGAPTPYLPAARIKRTMGKRASFDAGRGCPFLCSFCTIINVQGRRSRHRSADDVEALIRANAADGIRNFFITDDNFARNRNWEAILERIVALRASGLEISLVIQADTQTHRIEGFIDKAAAAGVNRVFIGLESIHPASLKGAQKGQNRIGDYRAMLQAWHAVGVLTYAGYIIGFPDDTPESIRRDIRIIQRELPIDIMEFFILTPLPGSKDHQRLIQQGVALEPDMNQYDTQHVTMVHPRMSRADWEAIYREVWDLYYSDAHVATVLRRCRVWGYDPKHMLAKLFAFHAPIVHERMHPLEGGLIRRKVRRDRRPGRPVEHPLLFYPRFAWDFVTKYAGAYRMHRRYRRILEQVMAEPDPLAYTDLAMTPVATDERERLQLYAAVASA